MWRAGDRSRQAHFEAEATLAQLRHDLGDVTGIDTDRYLVEPYRESDPSCAMSSE
jgi:hypothetical protein